MITADGVVTRDDGTVQVTGQMSPVMFALRSSEDHPILGEIYRILGSRQRASWVEFYKVCELLRQECGGDQALASRTGVPRKRIQLLNKNSNHQSL
jgi:ribosomal protein L20A (L18A)